MSFADSTSTDGTVEECLDELSDFVEGLRYPPTVLAVAMRVHLEAVLQALLEAKKCTREEVRDFVRELERDALQYEAD
jgi:MoxR-like ATPase